MQVCFIFCKKPSFAEDFLTNIIMIGYPVLRDTPRHLMTQRILEPNFVRGSLIYPQCVFQIRLKKRDSRRERLKAAFPHKIVTKRLISIELHLPPITVTLSTKRCMEVYFMSTNNLATFNFEKDLINRYEWDTPNTVFPIKRPKLLTPSRPHCML